MDTFHVVLLQEIMSVIMTFNKYEYGFLQIGLKIFFKERLHLRCFSSEFLHNTFEQLLLGFFNELSYKEAPVSSTNFWKTAPSFFTGELTETRFFQLRLFLSDENHKFDSFKFKLKCQTHKNLFFNEVAC